jgi:hypothetical protein
MATTTFDQADSGYPLFSAANCIVARGTKTFTVAPSANDVLEFCKIPAGHTLLLMALYGADLDTGTEALEIDVGITGTTTKYLNSGVITGDVITDLKPEAGIYYPIFKGLPEDITTDTTIIGTVTAAANAGGTGILTLLAWYMKTVSVGNT